MEKQNLDKVLVDQDSYDRLQKGRHLSARLSVCWSVCLSLYLFVYIGLSVCLLFCPSCVYSSV